LKKSVTFAPAMKVTFLLIIKKQITKKGKKHLRDSDKGFTFATRKVLDFFNDLE
jgi:hypothetical protein